MCRFLLAIGDFSVDPVVDAAITMARGETCPYPAPSQNHPHGFGVLWSDPDQPTGFYTYKSLEPLGAQPTDLLISQAGPSLMGTKLLAVHARFATRPSDMGLNFTHPLETNAAGVKMYFMHNGFTPFMYQHLGLSESRFDTEEYFRVVQNTLKAGPLEQNLPNILEPMGKPSTAANMFLFNDDQVCVFNWWPQGHEYADYFQMHILETETHTIISSDILPTLAPKHQWRGMSRGDFMTFDLSHGRSTDRTME